MDMCNFDKYRKSGAIHWAAISKNINKHSLGFNARYKACVNLLREFFQSDITLSILDIGCGDGTLFYFLKKAFPNSILAGVDGSKEGIELAQTYLLKHSISNVELKAIDFNKLYTISDRYDVVVVLDVIEHLQEPSQFLANVYDQLKDNGHLLLSTPVRLREFPKDKDHYKEFFPDEFKKLVEHAGYEVIKQIQIVPIFYLIRYFNPIRLFIGKSKLYKKFYNFLNIFFEYNVFLKGAPSASYELYETQFIFAKKKTRLC